MGATDAEHVGGVGTMDAEQLCPRHESGEAILEMWDGEEVGDAT
jgi:hypothetical protein